jgi:hypothetical protein
MICNGSFYSRSIVAFRSLAPSLPPPRPWSDSGNQTRTWQQGAAATPSRAIFGAGRDCRMTLSMTQSIPQKGRKRAGDGPEKGRRSAAEGPDFTHFTQEGGPAAAHLQDDPVDPGEGNRRGGVEPEAREGHHVHPASASANQNSSFRKRAVGRRDRVGETKSERVGATETESRRDRKRKSRRKRQSERVGNRERRTDHAMV